MSQSIPFEKCTSERSRPVAVLHGRLRAWTHEKAYVLVERSDRGLREAIDLYIPDTYVCATALGTYGTETLRTSNIVSTESPWGADQWECKEKTPSVVHKRTTGDSTPRRRMSSQTRGLSPSKQRGLFFSWDRSRRTFQFYRSGDLQIDHDRGIGTYSTI